MTKQDFIARRQAWRKNATKFALLDIVIVFAFGGSVAVVKNYVLSHGGPAWIDGACAIGLIVMLACNALFVFRFLKRKQRDFGLVCPHCEKTLIEQQGAQIVIATGNCIHCGEKLFDEKAPA